MLSHTTACHSMLPNAINALPACVQQNRRSRGCTGQCALQVEAVCSFVEKTGKPAGIGALQDAVEVVMGQKGTLIIPAAPQG